MPADSNPAEDEYFALMRQLEEDVLLDWEPSEDLDAPSPAQRWAAFSEVAQVLNLRKQQFEETLRDILRAALKLTGARRALLILRDERDRLRTRLAMDVDGTELDPEELPYSRTTVEWVADRREAVRIRDARDSDGPIAPSESIDRLGLRSILCAPLHIPVERDDPPGSDRRRYPPDRGGRVLGILYVDDDEETHAFADDAFIIFRTLASFASTIILNAFFYRELITDPRTGLVNRREFAKFLRSEVARARRTSKPLGIVLGRVEAYAGWIREHGWRAARRRLREATTRVRDLVRRNDVVGSQGGGHFGLVLPATDPMGAEKVCLKVVRTLDEADIAVRLGFASFPAHGSEAEPLLRMAEAALLASVDEDRTIRAHDPDGEAPLFRSRHTAGLFSGTSGDDVQHVEFLLETLHAVAGTRERERLFATLGEKLLDVSGAERMALLVPTDGELECAYAADVEGRTLEPGTDLWGGIPRAVRERDEPVHLDLKLGRPEEEPRPGEGVVHAIACPVDLVEGTGVIYLDSRDPDRGFGEREFAFCVALARESALAIRQAELRSRLRDANEALEAEKERVEELNEALREDLEAKGEVVRRLEAKVGRDPGPEQFGQLVGQSAAMKELFRLLDRAKESAEPVLITGESGTGKELIARSLHYTGPRGEGPFVAENCAAVPPDLLESELFGHEKGAFTGADRDKVGLVEAADGGTLFLDEVGDMPVRMQKDLLRVIQESKVRPVGSREEREVDVRIVAATHRDLEALVEEGTFRQDLFYRLHVIRIDVPPLRERQGDIPLLCDHLLERIASEAGNENPRPVSEEALSALCSHGWPGNVRQLENELRRAVALHPGPIEVEHLSAEVRDAQPDRRPTFARTFEGGLKDAVERYESLVIAEVLRSTDGDKTEAAELLQISRRTLYNKLDRYDI